MLSEKQKQIKNGITILIAGLIIGSGSFLTKSPFVVIFGVPCGAAMVIGGLFTIITAADDTITPWDDTKSQDGR